MTTATISQLGSDYTALIDRVEHGESIAITREGHTIALLTPAPGKPSSLARGRVDWTKSAAAHLAKTVPRMGMEDSRSILLELKGRY